MFHVQRTHRKSWDVFGEAHYLTFSCFHRQRFLSGRLAPLWFLQALDRARSGGLFDLWGFVAMPEHVHLLLLPAEGVKVMTILAEVKIPVSRQAIQHVRRCCPEFLEKMTDRQPCGRVIRRFWQRGGGYDRNLRSTHEIHEKLRYLHDNPVRRGLAARAEDWPWSSAKAWATGLDEPVSIDRQSLPALVLG